MGLYEDKIKDEVCKEVYAKIIDVYDFLETRFDLSGDARDKIIKELNSANDEVTKILKSEKLS